MPILPSRLTLLTWLVVSRRGFNSNATPAWRRRVSPPPDRKRAFGLRACPASAPLPWAAVRFPRPTSGLFDRRNGRTAIFTLGLYVAETRRIPFRDLEIDGDSKRPRFHADLHFIGDLQTVPGAGSGCHGFLGHDLAVADRHGQ